MFYTSALTPSHICMTFDLEEESYMGDYLNFVRKNKKVYDFSLKLGVTHWGITFFVIKKF